MAAHTMYCYYITFLLKFHGLSIYEIEIVSVYLCILLFSSQEVRWEGKVIVCECLCYEFVYVLYNGKPQFILHIVLSSTVYTRTTSRQQVIPSFRLSFTFRRESCSSKKLFSLSLLHTFIFLPFLHIPVCT